MWVCLKIGCHQHLLCFFTISIIVVVSYPNAAMEVQSSHKCEGSSLCSPWRLRRLRHHASRGFERESASNILDVGSGRVEARNSSTTQNIIEPYCEKKDKHRECWEILK